MERSGLRVGWLWGGYGGGVGVIELAKKHGVIASFSGGLLEDMRHHMNDDELDAALGTAIHEIHHGSTVKVSA